MSYASNESGEYEVYVRAFPSGESRRQVSIGGGRTHCWARDGRAIFYIRDSDSGVFRSAFQGGPSLEVGRPEPMFIWPASIAGGLEAAPTGERFLGVRMLPAKFKAEQVCVVLNWFDELKAKVPTGAR
jgi:hypothetical protein